MVISQKETNYAELQDDENLYKDDFSVDSRDEEYGILQ